MTTQTINPKSVEATDKIAQLALMAGASMDAAEGIEEKPKKPERESQEINLLHKVVQDTKVQKSLDSMEGVPENKTNFIRERLPQLGTALAAGMHAFAGASKAVKFLPDGMTNFLDKNSTNVTKIVNVGNYLMKGLEAISKGRAWDGIGRLMYPIVVPFMDQEDVFLSSGLSSGITMFEQGQRHKVGEIKTLAGDFTGNLKAFGGMISDIKRNGFGKDRLLFVPENKEKGHTMWLGANGNFFGALLGLAAGKGKSPLKKFASIVRNAGGIVCDWGKIMSPDINNKISGITYLMVSVLDVLQAFSPEPLASTLSHFSLAINNIANYFYVNTSKATSDGTYQDFKGNQAQTNKVEKVKVDNFNSKDNLAIAA